MCGSFYPGNPPGLFELTSVGWCGARLGSGSIGAVAGMLIAPVVFLEPNMGGILVHCLCWSCSRRTSELRRIRPRRAPGWRFREFDGHLRTRCRQRTEVADCPCAGSSGAADSGLTVSSGEMLWSGCSMTTIPQTTLTNTATDKRSGIIRQMSSIFLFLIQFSFLWPLLKCDFPNHDAAKPTRSPSWLSTFLPAAADSFPFGQSAFFAIGAYTSAVLVEQGGVNSLLTLPIAAAVCFVTGFLFGVPALRLSGVYLALATFALATAMPQLLKLRYFEPWTGGVQGM